MIGTILPALLTFVMLGPVRLRRSGPRARLSRDSLPLRAVSGAGFRLPHFCVSRSQVVKIPASH